MDYKKRIFIGSSSESSALGMRLKDLLERRGYACKIWNSEFFEYGHSYIEDLVRKIIAYDYAIMIGGPDDEVFRPSDGTRKLAPRDNIYLEYGLFSGVLSPYRTLLLISKKCAVASDLAGITLAQYASDEEAIAQTKKWITEKENRASSTFGREQIELLPTVGIAIGYYDNFLSLFKRKFKKKGTGRRFRNIKLTICIPSYIRDDIDDYDDAIISHYGLTCTTIDNLRLLVNKSEPNYLDVYDVPSTIRAVFRTVNYIWGVEGNSEDMEHAKLRALDSFAEHLHILIQRSEWLEEHVQIVRIAKKHSS